MSANVFTPQTCLLEPKPQARPGWSIIPGRSLLSALTACIGLASASVAQAGPSQWVYYDTNGNLAYQTTAQGDRIMDFSWAGYMGGGVALPNVPVRGTTLSPRGGTLDDTANIQARIDSVAAMTPDALGIRGTVLLSSGTFRVNGVISIKSGVVLRGASSSGSSATKLWNVNNRPYIVQMLGTSDAYDLTNKVNITNSYVPSGTRTFNVSSTSGYAVGNSILITRVVTASWIEFMEMHNLERDGLPQQWMKVGDKIYHDRNIVAISGNTITIDAPLTDSFDSQYLGSPVGTMELYTLPGRVKQAGLEKIFIECNAQGGGAFYANNVIDSWVSDVFCHDGMNTFEFDVRARRCTIDRVIIDRANTTTASPPADFSATGTQLFFNKCETLRNTTADKTFWTFSMGPRATGPLAILNLYSTEESGISPHYRWYTGILADNCKLPNAPADTHGISYQNRGNLGTGHGWTTGWSVAWNVETPHFLVQQAPGTRNWSIGGIGAIDTSKPDDGTYDSHGTKVTPSSLYLAQLEQRLGYQALVNIGYGASGVRFYQSYNYTGSASQPLPKGNYTMAQLAALGVPNDWASSASIPAGWTVTIYASNNFTGTSWVRTSDTPNFGGLSPSANDQMSSCKIE
jgi:hypothetical protein